MFGRDSDRGLSGVPLAGLALAILAVDTVFVVNSLDQPATHLALYGGGPALFALLLLGLSFRVSERRFTERNGLTVWVWALGFAFIAGGAAAYIGSLMTLGNGSVSTVWLLLLNSIALGAGVGAPLGYYYQEFTRVKQDAQANAEANRRLNQRLQVANRVLRHNLRNELTIVRGHLEYYADDPGEGDEHLATIHDALDRLLAFSQKAERIERIWTEDIGERTFDLDAVLADIIETTDLPETVELRFDLPDTDLTVYGHPFFPIALSETIENSLVHTDGGNIWVSASSTDDRVVLVVEDDGPGIPADELQALVASEETDLMHGSGLGLWFVKWVTEYSRGSVTFETGPSTGTTVTFELPQTAPDSDQGLPVLG